MQPATCTTERRPAMTITQTSPLPRFGRFADLLAPIGLLGGIIRRRESSPGDRGTQWTLAPQEIPPSEEGSRSPVAARALAAGQVAPPVRSAPATAHLPDGLTERQAEVLGLLAAGL